MGVLSIGDVTMMVLKNMGFRREEHSGSRTVKIQSELKFLNLTLFIESEAPL